MKLEGYLKIKTKIDNKDVDKGIAELENKIKKLQADNSNASIEQNSLQQEIDKYEKLQTNVEAYRQKIKELKNEKATMLKNNPALAVSVDTPEYSNINMQIEQMKQKYAQATAEIDKQVPKIEKITAKLAKIKAKQTENNAKIQQFKDKIESIKINKVEGQISKIGKGIQGQITKIGKMSMAIVGVRTAWNAVRSAINLVKQYNPQISADFQYMGYCISKIVAPAVQWLTKLLYTLLSYINAISKAWFGINLFSGASVKNFKKMQSSAGGTAKSAKEIQKSLQGFDEMNVLSDTSNTSAGGGSSVSTPSMDLSGIQGEVPKWLQWIMDNKDVILSVIAGIVSGLAGFKTLNLLSELGLIEGKLLGIKALGIGVLISGVVYSIQGLIGYLKDGSWENFGKIIQGIGVALVGLALIVGSVPLAVTGAIVLIVGTIVKYWEQIKGFFQSGIDWLKSKSDWVHEMFGDTIGGIYDNIIQFLQETLNAFDGLFTGLKGILDGILKIFKGIFSGDMTMVLDGFKQVFDGTFKALTSIAKIPLKAIGIDAEEVFGGIKNAIKGVYNVFKGIFTGDMKTVLNGFKQIFKGVFDALWGIAKSPLNLIIKGINSLIKGANKISFDVPDWVPGFGGKKFGFNIPQIPLLAKGGVISQPTQAIIGEAGREAVVPLENNMEWLDILADKLASKIGASGGSYIIQLDSRAIQRGLAKRQQELAFATNGR